MLQLKTSSDALESKFGSITRAKYVQVAPTRDVTGASFGNGDIHLKWQNSSHEWTDLSKSYLRFRVTLEGKAGAQLTEAENIAPNLNLASCLFQSMEFRINGVTVSRCDNYVPQIDTLVKRQRHSEVDLDGSLTFLESFGATQAERKARVTSDGGALRPAESFELCWRPEALGIWGIDHAMPVGNYELVLSPHTQSTIEKRAVESTGADVTGGGTDFSFVVDDMFLYISQYTGSRVDNVTYFLDFEDHNGQTEDIGSAALSQKHFEISPSTTAITVAYQDEAVDANTLYSQAALKVRTDQERNLTRMFLQYNGESWPSPDADPGYDETKDATVDRHYQRYMESMLETGRFLDGCESFDGWSDRGQYYHWNVPKDGKSRSTRLTVNQAFSTITNARVFVMATYGKVVGVQIKSGRIVEVRSENI